MFAGAGIDTGGTMDVEPLTGGVSSDIVRIRIGDGREFCAKRALPRLKVASDWQAPLERNHYEVAWLRRANAIVPGAAPRVIGEDRAHGIALLEYLPSEHYSLWKSELLAGRADPGVPAAVAAAIGRIHAATLQSDEIAAEFPTDHLIDALRFDPYLRFTAGRHPEVAAPILGVLEKTSNAKLSLVHGDLSPKNILISKADSHPVLLDAECAWYGDPTFDAAFCMNHLLLKSIHLPTLALALTRQAKTFFDEWLTHFPAALHQGLEQRTAALLPCLMLARVDGKSPVEYTTDDDQTLIRRLSISMLRALPDRIETVVSTVREAAR